MGSKAEDFDSLLNQMDKEEKVEGKFKISIKG